MADIKITALVEDTAPTFDDLLVTVNDPGGSPITKKIQFRNLPTMLGWIDIRTFMDGQSGRPTYATWYANQGTTPISSTIITALATMTPGQKLILPYGSNGIYLLDAGLVIDTSGITIEAEGWGAITFKANAAINMMLIRDADRIKLQGIKFDGNSNLALSGLSFIPTAGGLNQYNSINNVKIRECQTGLIVGSTNNFSVVGLHFDNFNVDICGIGIQQNGINTADIFYTNFSIGDCTVVGFDMGSSASASFRGGGSNGHNGAADFRAGSVANAYLSISDHIGNPVEGPFLLANGVGGQQSPLNAILSNINISYDGTPDGDIISWFGQGSLIMIGGKIGGSVANNVRITPLAVYSNSGPTLIDIGLDEGNPASTFVIGTGGRRVSLGMHSTYGNYTGCSLTNISVSESVKTFGNGDATPSVNLGNVFITAGTTAITDFLHGFVGQTIKIKAAGNITITNGATILLAGSANFDMTANDTLILTQYTTGEWIENSRSVN